MKTSWVCKVCAFETQYSEEDTTAICKCCETSASSEQILSMKKLFEEEHQRQEKARLKKIEEEKLLLQKKERERKELERRNQITYRRKLGLRNDKILLNIHRFATVIILSGNVFFSIKALTNISLTNMSLNDQTTLSKFILIFCVFWFLLACLSGLVYSLFGSISKRNNYINALDDKDNNDITIRKDAKRVKMSISKIRTIYCIFGIVYAILYYFIAHIW